MAKVNKKGYTVLDTIPVDEHKNRRLPNSDPAGDDNWTYQEQPWQEQAEPVPGDKTQNKGGRY